NRDAFLCDDPPRHLPATGRLTNDPDPDARPDPGAVAGLRDPAEADRDRARVVLLDRDHDARRVRLGRPRTAEAGAYVRHVATAGVLLGRAADGATRRLHRRQDRR